MARTTKVELFAAIRGARLEGLGVRALARKYGGIGGRCARR
jgi:hypothetical protein